MDGRMNVLTHVQMNSRTRATSHTSAILGPYTLKNRSDLNLVILTQILKWVYKLQIHLYMQVFCSVASLYIIDISL